MSADLQIRISYLTHNGSVRTVNQDSILVNGWARCAPMASAQNDVVQLEAPILLAVADGMGGHAAGDVASQFVAMQLSQNLCHPICDETISTTLNGINRDLVEFSRFNSSYSAMGSTLAGIVISSCGVIGFNVGDSRIYRFRDEFIRQLSIDDVPNSDQSGRKRSNIVTQALGGTSDITEIEPHVFQDPLVVGWRYLICSDGLTDFVDIDEIENVLVRFSDRAVSLLYDLAMEQGGGDNISIIIAELENSTSG